MPRNHRRGLALPPRSPMEREIMNSIVYIVGAVVIVLFVLSFLGLR
jgi:hypothetical protein